MPQARPELHREDLSASSDPGIRIHVREVRLNSMNFCSAILLVLGARVPGVASFDLPVPGGSLAADLEQRGFCVYIIDIRGYGESTCPSEMDQPQQKPFAPRAFGRSRP